MDPADEGTSAYYVNNACTDKSIGRLNSGAFNPLHKEARPMAEDYLLQGNVMHVASGILLLLRAPRPKSNVAIKLRE